MKKNLKSKQDTSSAIVHLHKKQATFASKNHSALKPIKTKKSNSQPNHDSRKAKDFSEDECFLFYPEESWVREAASHVDRSLFQKYISEFPCLKEISISLDNLDKCRKFFLNDQNNTENSAKELALDCILELLSGGDFEITWKDIFDIFSKEDQEAFIRVMQLHSQLSAS